MRFIIDLRRSSRPKSSELWGAYQDIFVHTPQGRMILEDLARKHFIGRPTFNVDQRTNDMNQGRQFVVDSMLNYLCMDEKDMRDFLKMQEDNSKKDSLI